jgi:hypothetical protein
VPSTEQIVLAGVILVAGCGALWLLVTPLVIEGRMAGDIETRVTLDARLSLWPVTALVRRADRGGVVLELSVWRWRLATRMVGDRRRAPAKEQRGNRLRRLRSGLALLGRARQWLRVRALAGYIRYGFEDPARTGQVHGILCAALADTSATLELEPDWSLRDCCSGWVRGGIEIKPLHLALAAATLLREA